MGVGRNLAYTKAEFFKTKGFINHIKVKSGDDDLFIQEAANKQNTAINLSQDSFTTSIPPLTFKAWFRQKRRHVSTANNYKFIHKGYWFCNISHMKNQLQTTEAKFSLSAII